MVTISASLPKLSTCQAVSHTPSLRTRRSCPSSCLPRKVFSLDRFTARSSRPKSHSLVVRATATAPDGSATTTESATIKSGPPPYTNLAVPVFSLSTRGSGNRPDTMNITTYFTPVAIAPTRMVAICLYKGTLTSENFRFAGEGVLQMLRKHHAPLVPLLGRASGRDVDKFTEVSAHGIPLCKYHDIMVMKDVGGLMYIKARQWVDCGDHDMVICDVVDFCDSNANRVDDPEQDYVIPDPLYTDYIFLNKG